LCHGASIRDAGGLSGVSIAICTGKDTGEAIGSSLGRGALAAGADEARMRWIYVLAR
jgi:hypothetical protein